MCTVAPAATSPSQAASPMPELAPVTSTVRPLRSAPPDGAVPAQAAQPYPIRE